MKSSLLLCITCCIVLCGCATDYSGNTYESVGVGRVERAESGVVVSTRYVNLENKEGFNTGTLLGATGGAIAGSMFGKGGGKVLGVASGAVLGGMAGNALQSNSQKGIEYTIKLDNDLTVVIAQGLEPQIGVGQRVNVIDSKRGRGRVIPA